MLLFLIPYINYSDIFFPLCQENDEFFELISSKFLSDTRYSSSIQAAAARLLLSCSLTWTVNFLSLTHAHTQSYLCSYLCEFNECDNMLQYPHVFEEDVLENIKKWVMEEAGKFSAEDRNWKHELGGKEVSDSEMLRTYSTGLLAVCLAGYDIAVTLLAILFHGVVNFV